MSCVLTAGSNCGGGGPSAPTPPTTPPNPTTTFLGTLAGTGNQTGTVNVTVQSSVARSWFPLVAVLHAQGVGATGVIRLVGATTTSVSGSFDSTSRALSLNGGGFSITGSFANGTLSGSYSGPGNSSGRFSALPSTAATVTTFCGTYSSSIPIQLPSGGSSVFTETGAFNLQVSSTGSVSGVYSGGSISGRATGNSVSITTDDGGTGVGTISGGSISGTGAGPNGRGTVTWNGSSGACPA